MNLSLLARKKILVVEDNSINQMLVTHTLSKSGSIINIANNGSHALTFTPLSQFDIILMDIHMPELDGYQTTRIIRNELHLNVPIIAMTALAIRGEDEKCKEIGMNGYVAKPFTTESLCSEIIKVLEQPNSNITNSLILSNDGITIDLNFLNELAGGDKMYVKTMLSLFVENMTVHINKLGHALATNDWSLMQKTAHLIKSSLSVVKANEMYQLAVELEKSTLMEKDEIKVQFLIQKLNQLYYKTASLLQKQETQLAIFKQVA